MTPFRTALLLGLLAFSLSAQTPPPPAPVVKDSEPDPNLLKGMKTRLFLVQHREVGALVDSLRPLTSGVRGCLLSGNSDGGLKTISVRDFPENLAIIEEALKRLDVPGSKMSDLELTVQVLFASQVPTGATPLPERLEPVVKALRGTLAYKHYSLGASFVQRAKILPWERGEASAQGQIQAQGTEGSESQRPKMEWRAPGQSQGTEGKEPSRYKVEWRANGLSADPLPTGTCTYGIREFRLNLEEDGTSRTLAKFSSPVTLKEGETVVIGTSVVKDRGVVVVLSARRAD